MNQERARWSWGVSGLKIDVEACPDASNDACLKQAAGLGLGGWGTAWLLGLSPMSRLLGAAAGATAGILAGRYHVYIDWDPDRARGEPDPKPEYR